MTTKRRNLLGLSAVTYLLFCLWAGPHLAFYLVVFAILVATWAALCNRYPTLGYFTYVFFYGFVGGLLSGLLGRGAGYAYYRTPRRYRRRS